MIDANRLATKIANQIIKEENESKCKVVVYSGRFQPFHIGHYKNYQYLVGKFGKHSVFIGTSDKVELPDSPFSFDEKQRIITTIFDIPSSQVIKVKRPYAPEEILQHFDKQNTAFITVVGSKDKGRLTGDYFQKYSDTIDLLPFPKKGYVFHLPELSELSSTQVRKKLGDPSLGVDQKRLLFNKYFGIYNKEIFNFITDKLTKEAIMEWILNKDRTLLESSTYIADLKEQFAKLIQWGTISVKYEPILEGKGYIMEGGAYGHLSHPFDLELNLSFGDLKTIVEKALEGELEFAREKTDGMQLSISWRDDRGLIAARNKSHLKNSGKNAMDIEDVITKFEGRGAIAEAYQYAMDDLHLAISSLTKEQRDKIFKNGKSFMSLEVIYPETVNVIPYGQSLLVFHGTIEYDEKGNPIGETPEAGVMLENMIKAINQDVQQHFNLQSQPVQELPKDEDLSNKKPYYFKKIKELQDEFNLSDNDGISKYHQRWWEQWIEEHCPVELDNATKMHLVKRWAFQDRSNRLNGKTISDPDALAWAKEIDKEEYSDIAKANIKKFEIIFLQLGAEVLSFMSSALAVNPDEATRNIKKKVDNAIKTIRNSSDNEEALAVLERELERLEQVGGIEKIVPSEGLVFDYEGNTLKLTGTFAPINQILNLMYKK